MMGLTRRNREWNPDTGPFPEKGKQIIMKKKLWGLALTLLLVLAVGCAVAAGVLEGDWVQSGGRWVCQMPGGQRVQSYRGYSGVRIPAKVNALMMKDFAGAGRDFVIYCEPGSYAESFALSNGLQYDNGVDRVVGYQIRSVREKADWIIEHYIRSDMSDGQKAKILHNWLVYNNFYDLSLQRGEIADVLLYGRGVCQAYADAYAMLLTRVGVENRTLISTTEMNHIWNVVKLGGRWVHIDVTWDDPIDEKTQFAISGEEDEAYYALSDGAMAQDHDWEEDVQVDVGNVGFVYAFGHTYYYSYGQRVTGWATLAVPEHVYNRWADGFVMRTNTDTYYFDETGDMAKGWQVVAGSLYYFRDDGVWQQTATPEGWLAMGTDYYYVLNGSPVIGWYNLNGTWYYFGATGIMATGWNQIGADWYYFNDGGAMISGWMELKDRAGNSLWYFMEDSGVRVTGWREISGTWYYFDADGIMATGLQTVNGSVYYFQGSGAMTRGWAQTGGRWYYLQDSGAAAVGWLKVDGVWYYFSWDGVMQTGTQNIGGQIYSFAADGSWIP